MFWKTLSQGYSWLQILEKGSRHFWLHCEKRNNGRFDDNCHDLWKHRQQKSTRKTPLTGFCPAWKCLRTVTFGDRDVKTHDRPSQMARHLMITTKCSLILSKRSFGNWILSTNPWWMGVFSLLLVIKLNVYYRSTPAYTFSSHPMWLYRIGLAFSFSHSDSVYHIDPAEYNQSVVTCKFSLQ